MRRPARPLICALALALASFAAGPVAAQDDGVDYSPADETPVPKAPVRKAQDRKAPNAKKGPGRAARAGVRTSPWWNDAKLIEELSLSEEQRAKMDRHLEAYRKEVPEQASRTAFNEALQAGKWKEARAELKKLTELAAASVRTRGDLKIDVLSLLTDEQRKTLVDRYPRMIYQPWARVMRGGTP